VEDSTRCADLLISDLRNDVKPEPSEGKDLFIVKLNIDVKISKILTLE